MEDPYETPEQEANRMYSRVDRIHAMTRTIENSILRDEALGVGEIREVWFDELGTNVIVPYLENIRHEWRLKEADYLKVGRRLTPLEVKDLQSVLHNVNALTTTIFLLQEWRG